MVGDVLSAQPQLAAFGLFASPSPAHPARSQTAHPQTPPADDDCSCAAPVDPLSDQVELSGAARPSDPGADLTTDEQQHVDELVQRDREVREHEAAHAAAAGAYAHGGASFEYETGPDGKQYAIGGEVQIDASPVPDDPAATIAKMETVRAAALAPAQPSAQDRRVAAQAAAEAASARAEQQRAERADVEADPAVPSSSDNSNPAPYATASVRQPDHRALSAYQRAATAYIVGGSGLDTRA